ncbi:PEP/pyruvate-binding domain-containing protein [Xanthobacter sp. DSM 24535]|uniref:PEP/pyruvate-binding domain-containing protein n=1 Tax=Roseixanthobacter psychrophilus TaxID=3119917 RepID=UPI00372B60FE
MHIARIAGGSTATPSAEIIGAKAANLARMAALGLPVPPAFVLPVELCAAIVSGEAGARKKLEDGLREGMAFLEQATGKIFGDRRQPLLVSVRSGAARSMPGMLDTVLNVGCTEMAVQGLIRASGNPRFAWDCRRRFLESYADVVLSADGAAFAQARAVLAHAEGNISEAELDSEALERLARIYEKLIDGADLDLPDHPAAQVEAAAQAVYRSWTSDRAITYRKLQNLGDLQGTAVTVQAMVYGNRGLSSGAGVAFSRDPSSGRAEPVIDVLFGAQGEDVVSGSRTPDGEEAIVRAAPQAAEDLRARLVQLEEAFRDVQDVEFTIDEGELWILQTRAAKRTPRAALRFAIDLVAQGLITPDEGTARLADLDLAALVTKRLVDVGVPVAEGISASAGVAVGRVAFDSLSAEHLASTGTPVVLVRPDTSTADVAGFAAAEGILTAVGGRTAHAALVARQLGKPCIVGCAGLRVDPTTRTAILGGALLHQGDWLTLDADAGLLYLGQGRIEQERPEADLAEVARWRSQVAEIS